MSYLWHFLIYLQIVHVTEAFTFSLIYEFYFFIYEVSISMKCLFYEISFSMKFLFLWNVSIYEMFFPWNVLSMKCPSIKFLSMKCPSSFSYLPLQSYFSIHRFRFHNLYKFKNAKIVSRIILIIIWNWKTRCEN